MSIFKTKSFLKLKKTWYKKLEKAGFEDAESVSGQDELLKTWHNHRFKAVRDLEARTTYYSNASWFLEHHCFDTSLEKRIWKCHAEGITLRETARLLKMGPGKVFLMLKKLKGQFNGRS